jgi:Fibronectin type III domain
MGALDEANWEKWYGANYPDDLNKDKKVKTGQDYFTIPVVDLKIAQQYSFNFQWVYPDGKVGPWSDGLTLTTASYTTALTKPVVTVTPATLGYTVSYTKQTDKNFEHAIIEESVSTSNTAPVSGWTEVAVTSSNPTTITIGDTLKRWVRVKLIDKILGNTPYSDPVSVTPVDPVAAAIDAIAPDPIQSATAVGVADSSDSSGISGIINISVVNAVATVPADFNGYIVKIIRQSDNREWSQTFFSKTYLSTLSVKLGIVVGQSYTLSVSTTDGRNQSVFVAITGNPISVSDTRTNTSTVTGSLSFSATDSILTVSWGLSADTSVDSYKIELTSNSDTTFANVLQTVYSKGTTASFGGLESNTTYRIRVTTKYAGVTGPLSTSSVTGTFTLDASGAISDGVAPTTNPAITASMVKSLFGAFAITFPPVTNPDDVKYEVFIKDTNSTGIVDDQYKVLEVGGTFAVIKTLADRTTLLSYGTNYFIAVRAKDNDGVSTGTVTAVGPIQTLQVANADLAADSVFANNIKAGEIDATKMVTDLLFAEKTINVGQSTSLNRVRLDGTTATLTDFPSGTYEAKGRIFIGAGNYYSSGTSFYADNTGRLSIGDKLRFDTSGNLTINGSGTFTGLLTAGSGSQVIKVGTGVNGSNNGLYIQQGDQYIYTDGTFSFGGGSLTGTSSSLNVSGTITVKGNSELQGDLRLVSPGIFYIGDNKIVGGSGDKIVINSSGIAAYASNDASPRFQLAKDGTGKIAGWTINATSLSSNGMIIDSSEQSITFKQGYEIDQESTSIAVVSATSNTGSSSSEDDVPDSLYSSSSAASASTTASTLAIRSTSGVSNGGALYLSQSPIAAVLRAGSSSITVTSVGLELNSATAGAYVFKNLADTSRTHLNYNYVDKPAMLMIKSDGTLSVGRTIFKSGTTETSIVTNGTHNHVGRIGDLIFSTAD